MLTAILDPDEGQSMSGRRKQKWLTQPKSLARGNTEKAIFHLDLLSLGMQ